MFLNSAELLQLVGDDSNNNNDASKIEEIIYNLMKSVNNFSMTVVVKLGSKGSCLYYFNEKNKKLERVGCDLSQIKLKMFHQGLPNEEKDFKKDDNNDNNDKNDISQELIDKMNDFTVLDTTGGGDSFASGFLNEWVSINKDNRRNNDILKSCLQLACACGTITVSRIGACPTPIPIAQITKFKKCLQFLMDTGNAKKV